MKLPTTGFIAAKLLLGRSTGITADISNKRYLLSAVIGIAFSFIPLCIALVVTDGMVSGIIDRGIELSAFHLKAIDTRFRSFEQLESLAKSFSDLPEVVSTWPERSGAGIITKNGKQSAIEIRAVMASFFEKDTGVSTYLEIIKGSAVFLDSFSCIIGNALASKLNLVPGSQVTIMTSQLLDDGTIVPRLSLFTVSGIISTGYQELDSLWCFIPLQTGMNILFQSQSKQFLGIKGTTIFKSDPLKAINSSRADFLHGTRLITWKESMKSQIKSLDTTKTLLIFIMWLIVFIASLNVSSAIMMMVIERSKEIAILKSFGASSWDIERIFIFAGMLTGIIGTTIGLICGMVIAVHINEFIRLIEVIINNVALISSILVGNGYVPIKVLDPEYYLQSIPIIVRFTDIYLFAFGSILISFFASILPARKAGKAMPLKILRKI